jgi:hypothetical protein
VDKPKTAAQPVVRSTGFEFTWTGGAGGDLGFYVGKLLEDGGQRNVRWRFHLHRSGGGWTVYGAELRNGRDARRRRQRLFIELLPFQCASATGWKSALLPGMYRPRSQM